MSGVRKHFWTVAVVGAGGCSRPRKYGICGCIPALVSSVERSSARGISDSDGRRRWPFSSKNERKPSRSSADVRIGGPAYRRGPRGLWGGAGGGGEPQNLPQGTGGGGAAW